MPSRADEAAVHQLEGSLMDTLASLSDEIQQHIAGEQWEALIRALDLRQQCLETLFSEAAAESEALKALASSILEQDAVAVTKIEALKQAAHEQILSLSKGRKALQSYGGWS